MACLLAALLPPAARGADLRPEQLLARREALARQKQQYVRSMRSLVAVSTRQITDVMSLRVVGRRLALRTLLQPWPNFSRRRADLDGFDTPASVSYTQFIATQPNARQFEFNLDDYPDPDTFVRLHVLWRPSTPGVGQLTLERTEQSATAFARVVFVQTAGRAQLTVFSNREPLGLRAQNFTILEPDFMSLREKHEAETERWLRPVFRRLRQDAAFAPDANSAWQVLASTWPLDPDVMRTVRKLLPDLGSPRPQVRTRAAADVARLGREGATALLRIDRSKLSLEQTARVEELLSRFRRMSDADAERLRHDPNFLMDCLYSDDELVRRLAARRLTQLLGRPLGIDLGPDADADSRIAAIQKLRATLPTTQPSSQPSRS